MKKNRKRQKKISDATLHSMLQPNTGALGAQLRYRGQVFILVYMDMVLHQGLQCSLRCFHTRSLDVATWYYKIQLRRIIIQYLSVQRCYYKQVRKVCDEQRQLPTCSGKTKKDVVFSIGTVNIQFIFTSTFSSFCFFIFCFFPYFFLYLTCIGIYSGYMQVYLLCQNSIQ